MLKNDYRRALIMLRPLVRGMSGHVRLERRTLTGTMRFTVQGGVAGAGALHALLMADGAKGWTVYPLGALATDSRGQSGLIASFDPRNLRALDLDEYTMVAIVRTGAGDSELVMTGMVNGSKEINWLRATEAALAPYGSPRARVAPRKPVEPEDIPTTLPECSQEVPVEPEDIPTTLPEYSREVPVEPEDIPMTLPEYSQEVPVEPEDIPMTLPEYSQEVPVAPGDIPMTLPEYSQEVPVAPEDIPMTLPEYSQEVPVEPGDELAACETPCAAAACLLLGLDMERIWPEAIAAIRELFERNEPSDAFALEDFVFVDAPLPQEDGTLGVCAIGLRAQDAAPVSVCYALPGDYSMEPPPGLEGYQYLGGWWYTVLDVVEEVNTQGEIVGR